MDKLAKTFKFDLIGNIVKAQLPDKQLNQFLGKLFK